MNATTAGVVTARSAPRPLVSIDGCSVHRGTTPVLRDLSLDVRRGELLAIVGPSGCGKSTLLRLLLGLTAPQQGVIERDSSDAATGIVFQRPVLMPWLRARANVEMCLRIGPAKVRSAADRRHRAERALKAVGLEAYADYFPHQLSGGMQQRVGIARALVTEPSLLLMDEPFGALDELTRETMNREVLRLWEGSETRLQTVVLVTHSIAEAIAMADRVVVMTPRPSSVAAVFPVNLPKPRSERYGEFGAHPEFQALLRAVRSRLGLT